MNITDEQINKIFELASMEKKENVTLEDISEALIKIERKIYSFSVGVKVDSLEDKKVLIADDLELSIYQLSTILKKIGINPVVTRHKDETIAELNKVHYDCIILDLFIPDSSDGFELIDEAVKKRVELNHYTKIIVISGTDDSTLIEKCYEKGADFYIQKDKNWHLKLLKYLSTSFQNDKNMAFTRYVINNDIASFIIKRFDNKVFESIVKNINFSFYTGVKHVLFDLKEITSFDEENANFFSEIYKICTENKGRFIIINPPTCIQEALSFAYLEDIIPISNSVEEAVSIISEAENINQ